MYINLKTLRFSLLDRLDNSFEAEIGDLLNILNSSFIGPASPATETFLISPNNLATTMAFLLGQNKPIDDTLDQLFKVMYQDVGFNYEIDLTISLEKHRDLCTNAYPNTWFSDDCSTFETEGTNN